MNLSEHFTLAEGVRSHTATCLGIDNTPTDLQIEAMKFTAQHVLEPVRAWVGHGFSPSSFYRSLALCDAIGSKRTSQHAKGEAVDIDNIGVSNLDLAQWIAANISFDQLILEYWRQGDPAAGWVHCSVRADGQNRGEMLRYDGARYMRGLI